MNAHERHRNRTLWLTGLLHAFTHVYQVALMPLYLLIQRDFKFASVGQATLLLTVMMAACFGPSYPIGVLADKLDRKKLLGFGLALNGLGFGSVGEVRQGKVIDLELSGSDAEQAKTELKAMCEKLLANTVIEKYEIELK